MKRIVSKKKRIIIAVICCILALISAVSFTALGITSNLLDSQKEAKRWQGDSETEFSQLSCYLPADSRIKLEEIYKFRMAILTKFKEAALDIDSEDKLFVDAWSSGGKVTVSTSLGKGDVHAIAVGGSFFQFHPIRLISGNYIEETDLMKDRVLLDEDTAWLLFGGTDLQGMELRINGIPFVVAGVIEREQDFASKRAYTAGMGIYMSYDGYKSLFEEEPGISCYELCMAEPVDGFAQSFVKEKFPLNGGDLIKNTSRYSVGRLLKLLKQFGSRSMQTMGLSYPYWENAARCTEDFCLLYLFIGILTAIAPVMLVIITIVRYLRRGKEKLTEDVFPKIKDNAQEAIRVRQRRRWEKKHGMHEK